MNSPTSSLDSLSIPLSVPYTSPTKPVPVFVPHPTEPDSYIFRIDNSTLTKFQVCPRAAEYYVLNRRTSNRSDALVFGGAIHKGLETLYTHGFNPESLLIAKQRCVQHFLDNPCPLGWRTDSHAVTCLEKYYAHYKDDTSIQIFHHEGRPFVERSFEIEVGHIDIDDVISYSAKLLLGDHYDPENPNHNCQREGKGYQPGTGLYIRRLHIHWIGRLDALVTYYNKLMVMDHKTTTMLGDTFYADFQLGQQPIGYTWACRRILGYRPDGFLLNPLALRKPTPSGKPFEFPTRQPYWYTDEQLDEWEANVTTLVADFISHALRGFFPQNTVNCVYKYGMCNYHQVCTLPSQQRSTMLSTSIFSPVTWDPTADDA